MLSRLATAAALLAAVATPALTAATAGAAPRPALPKVAGVSTPQDDYLVGSVAPVKVRVAAKGARPRKAAELEVRAYGKLVAKEKLPKGDGPLVRTVDVKLGKVGLVTISACVAKQCKSKKVRVFAAGGPVIPGPSDTPKTYHLVLDSGSLDSTFVGDRMADESTYCGGNGFALHGRHTRSATLAGASAVEDENVLTVNADGTISGQILATAPAHDEWPSLNGCMRNPNGTGVVACSTSRSYDGGGESLGFSFESTPGDPSTVTLSWSLPQPDVGFVDYGDDVCNVSSIAQYLSEPKTTTVVPRDTFMTDGVKTLSISGSETFSKDFVGEPAHIDASWTQTVRLKRVP